MLDGVTLGCSPCNYTANAAHAGETSRYPRLQYVLKRPETLGKPWAPAIVHRWGPPTVQQRQWQKSFSRRQCPGHHQACQPVESEVVIFWANTMYFCLSVADIHPHFKPEKWLISWLSKLRSSMIFNCYLQIDTNRSFPGKKLFPEVLQVTGMRQRYLPPAGTDAPQPMASCPTSSARCFTAPWHQNEP